MASGESGFIYVSMGSSVKASKMPEHLRKLFIRTFAQIPYRVIWKYEGGMGDMKDLPPNVKIGTWLPQQDILGLIKIIIIIDVRFLHNLCVRWLFVIFIFLFRIIYITCVISNEKIKRK